MKKPTKKKVNPKEYEGSKADKKADRKAMGKPGGKGCKK